MNIEVIKNLRGETGAGVMDVKKALEASDGDIQKARKELMRKGKAKAAKKTAERTIGDGLVYSYIHSTGKIGSMILVGCETDFVAKTDDFKNLCKEIAMQACADNYRNVEALMKAEYIRDSNKLVEDLVSETSAKLGEKIEVLKFIKFAVSE